MKIAVAMSGGVDSSVAAALLLQEGHEVFGLTMRQYNARKSGYSKNEGIEADIKDAQTVCDKLGIKHFVVDLKKDFRAIVEKNFIEEYSAGRTPNPCVICNPTIKFGKLMQAAFTLGADKIATGHYIQINEENGQFKISIPKDASKDQTYMIWKLNQFQLSKTLFPVSQFNKPEIRKIAAELDLPIHSKTDSQEICFIKDHYEDYLKDHIVFKPGDITLPDGKVIGKHRGLALYTIGQRKGLNTPWRCSLYVMKLDVNKNKLVVTENPDDLLAAVFELEDVNWIAGEKPEEFSGISIQIRYNSGPVPVKNIQEKESSLLIELENSTRAITPGQSGVFYRCNQLLGGGIIK
ncbi:MAG: tRNA 2-thiouridine(34) synthase MnmA [Candidatus Cloacimonetes bacterium]|jgi:tRNA-specific 2-thiouridylase|nr:tRNA 2-thiouridine(34) synthase MnmA [Candidatus Cloacimonadota bacterium]